MQNNCNCLSSIWKDGTGKSREVIICFPGGSLEDGSVECDIKVIMEKLLVEKLEDYTEV